MENDEVVFVDFYYVHKEGVETPRLSKTTCSSLSEFFCKPLFPEAFLHHNDGYDLQMLKMAQKENVIFNDPLVVQAFEQASRAHNGQVSVPFRYIYIYIY